MFREADVLNARREVTCTYPSMPPRDTIAYLPHLTCIRTPSEQTTTRTRSWFNTSCSRNYHVVTIPYRIPLAGNQGALFSWDPLRAYAVCLCYAINTNEPSINCNPSNSPTRSFPLKLEIRRGVCPPVKMRLNAIKKTNVTHIHTATTSRSLSTRYLLYHPTHGRVGGAPTGTQQPPDNPDPPHVATPAVDTFHSWHGNRYH